jgi:aminopeptidase N
VYLDVAAGLASDTTSKVLSSIAGRLDQIGEDLVTAADQAAYQAWIRAHFANQLNAMGLPGSASDTDEAQSRRATLLSLVGIVGNDRDVQARSRELATQYLNDPRALPATIAGVVLRVAALNGDAALYDQYVSRLATLGAQPEQYYRLFNALPSFKDPALSKRTLEYAMSKDVRTQDTGTLIGMMMVQPWSRETTWSFVQANWQTILKNLGEFQGIPSIVESLGAFCSAPRAAEIRTFFEKNPIASSQRAAQQSVERVENCVALTNRQRAPLASWLAANRH